MATEASALRKALNAAIAAALQDDPQTNGVVYATYDNKDLGIQESGLQVQA